MWQIFLTKYAWVKPLEDEKAQSVFQLNKIEGKKMEMLIKNIRRYLFRDYNCFEYKNCPFVQENGL